MNLNFVILILLTHLFTVLSIKKGKLGLIKSKRRQIIKTKQCRYVFVVKEMDTSNCPGQLTSEPPFHREDDDTFNEIRKVDMYLRNPGHQKSKVKLDNESNYEDIEELNNRIHMMEQQLNDEKQKNNNLNMTISKQENKLQNMHIFINKIKTEQHNQQLKFDELEKKFINMELDVAEVNNVLTKKGSITEVGLGDTHKEVPVQSATKTHSCAMTEPDATFRDCQEIYEKGYKSSGIYHITPMYSSCSIPVYCDMDTPPGGWLVIQKRNTGKLNFNLFWNEYREGFGNIAAEYWLGLDNMFLLSNQDHYELRVDIWDYDDNKVYALYKNFKLDGERDKYKLNIQGFEGSARDSLINHNRMKFSTIDNDNDNYPGYHCAKEWQCGWWFNGCFTGLLNGEYSNKSLRDPAVLPSIAWNSWKKKQLAKTELKIRPSKQYNSQDGNG